MSSNDIRNLGLGPQNIAAGSGDQFNQNGLGTTQIYNSTLYGFRNQQIEAADELREEREACLGSLAFDAIYARLHDIDPAHHGTCDWFFSTPEFHEWQRPARLPIHNGVLWIKGKPGVGKSILMKHILVKCEKSVFRNHTIAAHFFNARGEVPERTPLGMLRSIVHQLLERNNSFYQEFIPRFREKQRASRARNWQWREAELQEFLRSIANTPRSPPLLLFIDALDECNDSDVRNVIDFIESLSMSAVQATAPLKICLSSRHYPSIRMGKMLEFTVERCTDHQADISKYLAAKLRIRETSLEKEVLTRANGIFLWVKIVVSLLNKAYDEGRLEAMWKTLDGIPGDLEKIFSALLVQRPSIPVETMDMLQWVLLSIRPLEPRELFAAVVKTTPPANDIIERRIVTSSKGLVEMRKGRRISMQFIHLSVSDFLLQQNRLETLDPTLGSKPIVKCHSRIWARCRSCIERANTKIIDPKQIRNLRAKDPFLGYAARHILDHAERALANDPNLQRAGRWWPKWNAANTPNETPIREWLRESNDWLRWWKSFIIAAGSEEERLGLKCENHEEEVGIAYVLALHGLPNLCRATLHGVDVNLRGGWYGTALQAASYGGHWETVDVLLQKGADINAKGGHYGNALQAASYGGHMETIKLLLEHGANISAEGGFYGNALQAASYGGHKETIDLLLQRGADIDAQGGYYGYALQAASYEGHQDVVELLLQRGANIDAQSEYFGFALQAAAFKGHQDTVELLLREGADVNAHGGYYGHALQAASYEGHQDVVELLLQNGADISAKGGHYGFALQAASYGRCRDIVELLIDRGANVNSQGGYFDTALQAASNRGHRSIVELLLEKNADVNLEGGKFGNALQAASVNGYRVILKMLLQKGVNVSAHGGYFGTALQAASFGGSPATVKLLVEEGADVLAGGGKFGSSLQAACREGHYEVVQLLVEQGADLNAQGGKYGNALQAAASRGNEDIVKFLLDHGANVSVQGGKYGSALQAAKSGGYERIEKLLPADAAISHSTSEDDSTAMTPKREMVSPSKSDFVQRYYTMVCAMIVPSLVVFVAYKCSKLGVYASLQELLGYLKRATADQLSEDIG